MSLIFIFLIKKADESTFVGRFILINKLRARVVLFNIKRELAGGEFGWFQNVKVIGQNYGLEVHNAREK